MPSSGRRYSYGAGPKVSRRTLYRRRMAEGRRVERLNQIQWKNSLDEVLMKMASSTLTSSSGGTLQDGAAMMSSQFEDTNVDGERMDDDCCGGNRTDQGSSSGGIRFCDGDRTDVGSGSGGDHTDARSCSRGERTDSVCGGHRTEEDSSDPGGAASADEPYLPEHHERPFDCDPHEFDADLLRRLCDCTSATIGETIAMVMSLGVRHSITWAGMVDILRLINVLFSKRVVPDTKYLFLKYVDPSAKYQLERHVYCAHCHRYFGKQGEEEDDEFDCACKPDKKLSHFMTIGLKKQLQDLVKRKEIQEGLQLQFQARQHEGSAFTDIFDGRVYRMFCLPGGLLFKNRNFTVSFFTDGVAMGKSSKRSVWPIYVVLNELPPRLRFKHMMLAGIWVGPKDPNMFVFLRPFVDDVNSLTEDGIQWSHDGTLTTSKVIPLSVCVDSPARCKMLNMKQFHGKDSCGFCYHPGSRVQGVIGYRYSAAVDLPHLRTDSELRNDMNEALRRIREQYPLRRQVVRGVQGPSALMSLNHFNLATMILPDLMHLYKLVETMLFMYQDPSRQPHLDEPHISRISSRLESFRLPSSISRSTRPLSQLKLYKCNELRNYLLLFGVVAMKGILCDKYVAQFSLLSSAIRLLVTKTVTTDAVHKANALLLQFVCLHEKHFGLKAMTINVHLLLHLCKAVLDHGPLWASNCFPYEGENRKLLNFLQSPAAVAEQLTRKFVCKVNSTILCDKYRVSDEVRNFCELLGARKLKYFRRSDSCVLAGVGSEVALSTEEQNALRQLELQLVQSVTCFDRIIHNGVRLTTRNYSSGLKTDDSCVVLSDGSKGQILKICVLHPYTVLLVKIFVEDSNPVFSFEDIVYTDVSTVVADGGLKAVTIKDVIGQCFLMEVDAVKYITVIPFGCYGD